MASGSALAAVSGIGTVLTTTPEAAAAIVYSGIVNINVPDTLDGIYLNVVTGSIGATGGAVPGWDLNPYTAGTGFNLWGATTTTWLSTGGVIAGPYPLALGTPIDSGGTYFRPGGGTDVGPQITLNSPNYLGFQFINEANSNLIHYGWLRIDFGATDGDRIIIEYAYEDQEGVGILAGAGSSAEVVPETSTLSLLALGAVGLLRRRRAA